MTAPVNGAVADGVNTNSVQAVVSDSGGNPVTGATVVFSSRRGGGWCRHQSGGRIGRGC
nr:Ig-like domain-containing protein [Yersinia pestis]